MSGVTASPSLARASTGAFPWHLLGVLPGLALIALAALSPAFRDVEGALAARFCLPLAAGTALALVGAAAGTRWLVFTLWIGLALCGQAVALQLIDAGRLIHFQHYRFDRPALLAALALQTAVVAAGIAPHLKPMLRRLREHVGPVRVLAAAAITVACGAAAGRDLRYFALELALAALIAAVALGNLVLAGRSLPDSAAARLRGWFDPPGRPRLDGPAWAVAAATTLAAALLAWFVYERHPHIPDEALYVLQARYFADGLLQMPASPVPEAFSIFLMTSESARWFSCMPPGWPAVLALGVLAGAPWLVNPLLAGVNILLAYLLLGEIFSRRIARIGLVLLACSPWQIFMAMNLMTHTLSFTCVLVAALAVARSRRGGSVEWALGAGIALGAGALIRPLDGAVAAVLVGLWALGAGARRLRFPALAALAAGTVATAALSLPYNLALTGSPRYAPVMAYMDKYFGKGVNDLGFGANRGMGWQLDAAPGHGFAESLVNDQLNAFSLNTELFGWGCGSLGLAVLGALARRRGAGDRLMLAAIAATLFAYTFYWYHGGPDFGARYWYLMLLPLVALTARGVEWLDEAAGGRAAAVMAALCGIALVTYVPWRALDKYRHYLRMRPDARTLIAEGRLGPRDLVLVRGQEHPDFISAAVYNPLDLRRGGPVFAHDRDPGTRRRLLAAWPGRRVWLLEGPTLTGRGYRLAPFTPEP